MSLLQSKSIIICVLTLMQGTLSFDFLCAQCKGKRVKISAGAYFPTYDEYESKVYVVYLDREKSKKSPRVFPPFVFFAGKIIDEEDDEIMVQLVKAKNCEVVEVREYPSDKRKGDLKKSWSQETEGVIRWKVVDEWKYLPKNLHSKEVYKLKWKVEKKIGNNPKLIVYLSEPFSLKIIEKSSNHYASLND